MLDKIRAAASSWIVKFFLLLVLIGFIVWEVPALLNYNYNKNILFSSGDSIVKPETYQTHLRDRILRTSYQTGHYLTPEEITQLQIPHMVMQQMQTNLLLDEAARKLQVRASEKSSAFLLNKDPFFKGRDGKFDKEGFFSYAQQTNIAHNETFDILAKQTLRNQLIFSIIDGITVPKVLSYAFSRYLRESRTVTYLELTQNIIHPPANPDEESLYQWFAEKGTFFNTPEYRRISFIFFSVDDVAHPDDITLEEIKSVYEKNIDQYIIQERRVFETLQFDTQKHAEITAEQLKKGIHFPSIVVKMGKTLQEIRSPLITKADLPVPFGENVFSLEKGTISPIINTSQGPVLVRVIDIKPAQTKPLEDVQEEIRKNLARHKAFSLLDTKKREIEEDRFEGSSLLEIANQHKLLCRQIMIDALGKNPEGSFVKNIPNSSLFLSYVFQSAADVDMDPITVEDGYLWYHVDKIIPSRARSLSEVRQDALALWKKEKVDDLLDQKAALLKQALKDGKSFEKVASENNLRINNASSLQRIHFSESLGKEATIAAFSGKNGFITTARGKDKTSRIIMQVIDVLDPKELIEDSLTTHENNELLIGIQNDLLWQFLYFLNKEHPIEINSELYNTLLSF